MPIPTRNRFSICPKPMMDEESMLPAAVAPVYPHQRGRRRSPAPVPPPHALYDPSTMRLSLAMTPAHPSSISTSTSTSTSRRAAPSSQRARQPQPRQQTPGGNGTFRGRRRYRSPSLSMTSAIRKASASTRPHTPSPAMSRSESRLKSKSRPSSPLSPGATSIHARGESSSPRRVIFRATVDMDHSVYPYLQPQHQQQQHHHHYHLQQLHAHLHHLHPVSSKTHKPRRAHCPSRTGSVDGSGTRRRRRQRTRSRPRYTGDTVSEMYEMSVAAALAQSSMTDSSSPSPRSDATNAASAVSDTRCQVSIVVDANGTSHDDNVIDMEP